MSLDVHPLADELSAARRGSDSISAATMTLAIFFEDAKLAPWVTERVHVIADKHPSRVLIFDGSKNEGDQHAEQSARAGEWVQVGVNGSSADELAAALSMLALPEAPIVLGWISIGIERDDRFVMLAKRADTVVVSSSAIVTDETALLDLMAFRERYPDIAVQDVSYLRLAAWQELIAEFFDEPSFLAELTALNEVQIAGGSEPEMYYLLGWLASRLNWTPCAPGELCNSAGDLIRFSLAKEGAPRRLGRVMLKSKDTIFTAYVLPDDEDAVCLEVTGAKTRPKRCTPLHSMDIASLIERAILGSAVDDVFMASLAMAKLIIERKPV